MTNMALEQFQTFYDSVNGSQSNISWRDTAYQSFIERGLPSKKNESWRYSKLAHWYQHFYPAASVVRAQADTLLRQYNADIVVVDGVVLYAQLPAGVQASGVTEANATVFEDSVNTLLKEHHTANSLVDFTLACCTDACLIQVDARATVARLKIVHVCSKKVASNTLQCVRVAAGARIHIEEHFVGAEALSFQQHHVAHFMLAEGATCTHDKYHEQSGQGNAQVYRCIEQQASSHYHANHYHFNNVVVRDESVVLLKEAHASCKIWGMSATVDSNWQSTHVRVMHLADHCESTQLYRSLVADKAQQSFQGEIYVPKGVQGTIAHQDSKSILLGKKARSNVKPFLEIYTDDVVCSHSATVGQLDRKAVFYMRSRGLTETQACYVLLHAFVNPVVEAAYSEAIKALVDEGVRSFGASLAPAEVLR